MLAFVARRLLATVPVLAMVAVFVFLMLRLTPGDPAAIIAGDNATAAQIAEIRDKLGLSEPILEQFVIWIGNLLHGDLGESFFFKAEVTELIGQRVGPTLALATVTMIITVLIAVPLGVIAAYKHGSWIDRLVMAFSVIGFSVPVFVLGYLLIYLFALELKLFPVQGYRSITDGFGPFIYRLILPGFTLSVIYIALIARITRASVLDVLGEDYIRTAYAKGLTNRVVLMRHALRNAAVPLLTVAGLALGHLLGGSLIVEWVFAWPGMGDLAINAIHDRDYPLIQGFVLFAGLVYVLVNFAIDLGYAWLDPRVRVGAKA